MIDIMRSAERARQFFHERQIDPYRIFVRLDFRLDIYAVVPDQVSPDEIKDKLYDFLNIKPDAKRVRVSLVRESELADSIYDMVFTDGDSGIDYSVRHRFNTFFNESALETADIGTKAPIVTFYSYKGGMGRTTALVSYALDLVLNHSKRVAIIDCDLEAPGYLNFFNVSKEDTLRHGQKNGFVEFLADSQFSRNTDTIDINGYMLNVGTDLDGNSTDTLLSNLWLVPGGNLNEGYNEAEKSPNRRAYLEGLGRLNLSNPQAIADGFRLLFSKIEEAVHPDIILIDSRTGFNDIFGAAALHLSKRVVGFFGFSRQTEPGLANLLAQYYVPGSNFDLNIVFSIIPNDAGEWEEKQSARVKSFAEYNAPDNHNRPEYSTIHRNSLLEQVGTDTDLIDKKYYQVIKDRAIADYTELFDIISQVLPEPEQPAAEAVDDEEQTSILPYRAIDLRNVILHHLREVLAQIHGFAEECEIDNSKFFYRRCMQDFFNPRKFIIQGYKGTGKTYLYRGLTNQKISHNIQRLAGKTEQELQSTIFVPVLPLKNEAGRSLPFKEIDYQRPDITRRFNYLWRIYAWNQLLLLDEFAHIRSESPLAGDVHQYEGSNSLRRINALLDKGLDAICVVDDDMRKINQHLKDQNKTIVLLYDRLDSEIEPVNWNKAVAPLIEYWRNNLSTYSNIIPKIFIRTDLFRRIEGTNTQMLNDVNTINIEWSMGEVFGYLLKMIYSGKESGDAFWKIMQDKIGIDPVFLQNRKRDLQESIVGQFSNLSEASIKPLVNAFFGKAVVVGNSRLGSPWDYFSKELANADNSAIALRPFINTLNKNAVDRALNDPTTHVQCIISPTVYASKEVRDKAASEYFNDLTNDSFSSDLKYLLDLIRSDEGAKYKYKSLTEKQFTYFINDIYALIENHSIIKSTNDLVNLILASGIMARVPTTNGIYYRFAPIYWYHWGLANSDLENNDERSRTGIMHRRGVYCAPLNSAPYFVDADGNRYRTFHRRCDSSHLYDGDRVVAEIYVCPDKFRPGKKFYQIVAIDRE